MAVPTIELGTVCADGGRLRAARSATYTAMRDERSERISHWHTAAWARVWSPTGSEQTRHAPSLVSGRSVI